MVKKLLDSKPFYIALSILIALALWSYVSIEEGVTSTDTVSSIPFQFEGEDILQQKGLMITSDLPSVSVKYEATSSTLIKLKQEGAVTASVDVSSISQPGTYTLAYEISYSGVSKSAFTVVEQDPVNVTFQVEKYVTDEVAIRGEFEGSLADGYMFPLEKFEFLPQTLSVSGLETDVAKIAYALVTICEEDLSESLRGDFEYQLIGWDGQPLDVDSLEIECGSDTVYTTLRVLTYAEIPLTVDFIDGGGATLEENVTWDIYPTSITVAGEKADLESLIAREKLSVATIDLAEIGTGITVITQEIPLSSELTNLDGVTEVTITITVSGLVTKTLEVTTFDLQNVPDGFTAAIQTKTLYVVVRGTEEQLATVSAANLRVVADLSGLNAASGQYTITATIYFDSIGDSGVVGSDYQLAIRLTET